MANKKVSSKNETTITNAPQRSPQNPDTHANFMTPAPPKSGRRLFFGPGRAASAAAKLRRAAAAQPAVASAAAVARPKKAPLPGRSKTNAEGVSGGFPCCCPKNQQQGLKNTATGLSTWMAGFPVIDSLNQGNMKDIKQLEGQGNAFGNLERWLWVSKPFWDPSLG